MWTCPRCQAKADDRFEVCWRCGTSSVGEEDPFFVRADDVAPSSHPSMKLDHKAEKAQDLELAGAREDVVACYWARNCNEAMFLANQLLLEGIPATADSLDLRVVLAGFYGLVPAGPYFGPRVWAFARDLPRARSWLSEYEQRRRGRWKRGRAR
jgi:hypothetical protein